MAFDFPNAPTVGQTYSGWVWDGEKWVTQSATPNVGGIISVQVFIANGTYTPSPNMATCLLECVGGGGGGGGATNALSYYTSGGGGGGGGYARKLATAAQIGIAQAVNVGAGGAGGIGTGGTANPSSIGSLCIALGGAGGTGGTSGSTSTGGNGGSGSTGDFLLTGGNGAIGFYASVVPNHIAAGGAGGGTYYGPGTAGRFIGGGAAIGGNAGALYGCGGGGGCSNNQNATNIGGGNGAAGLVVITEYGMTALSPSTAQLGSVRYDLPQGLTAPQQVQAQQNIGASTFFGCGRLVYVSATQIKFVPYNGNNIRINGVVYQIPGAGITAANTGVYVNGVAGQNLVNGTGYHVYLFNNAGTLTFDFVPLGTGHGTDGTATANAGTEIKNGDPTRSLIGMICASGGSAQFFDTAIFRYTRSWFNRQRMPMRSAPAGANISIGTSMAEVSANLRLNFVCWADDAAAINATMSYFSGTAALITLELGYDGTGNTSIASAVNGDATGRVLPWAVSDATYLTEGLHYVTAFASATLAASTYSASYTSGTIG